MQELMDFIQNNASNDQLIDYLTNPIGLGLCIALMAFCYYMKFRVTFVIIGSVLGGIYVLRNFISGGDGPDTNIYWFIGGAALIGSFVIYFTLMQHD